MSSPSASDRFRGCLVGVLTGDLLGAPFEGMSGAQIARESGGRPIDRSTAAEILRSGKGFYTDDTSQTMCVAESIVERGAVDPDAIASRLVHWFKTDGRGIGLQTWEVFDSISRGRRWQEASFEVWTARDRDAAGNGSLMRFAPVALALFDAPTDELQARSSEVSSITHWDPRCRAACFGASVLLRELASVRPERAVEIAAEATEVTDRDAAGSLRKPLTAREDEIRGTGFVLDTLTTAVWSLLRSHSFEEAILAAVNLGDDTDTTAAVAGALAGFYYGLNGIPEQWRAALRLVGAPAPWMVELADRLWEISRRLHS